MHYVDHYASPLGRITLAGNGQELTGLWFDGQKYFAATLSAAHEEKDLPIFQQTKRWLELYFRGTAPEFTPPLHLTASPFRLAVWDILRQIPYGQVITYGEIARRIAQTQGLESMSAQAVGGAVGTTPFPSSCPAIEWLGATAA